MKFFATLKPRQEDGIAIFCKSFFSMPGFSKEDKMEVKDGVITCTIVGAKEDGPNGIQLPECLIQALGYSEVQSFTYEHEEQEHEVQQDEVQPKAEESFKVETSSEPKREAQTGQKTASAKPSKKAKPKEDSPADKGKEWEVIPELEAVFKDADNFSEAVKTIASDKYIGIRSDLFDGFLVIIQAAHHLGESLTTSELENYLKNSGVYSALYKKAVCSKAVCKYLSKLGYDTSKGFFLKFLKMIVSFDRFVATDDETAKQEEPDKVPDVQAQAGEPEQQAGDSAAKDESIDQNTSANVPPKEVNKAISKYVKCLPYDEHFESFMANIIGETISISEKVYDILTEMGMEYTDDEVSNDAVVKFIVYAMSMNKTNLSAAAGETIAEEQGDYDEDDLRMRLSNIVNSWIHKHDRNLPVVTVSNFIEDLKKCFNN